MLSDSGASDDPGLQRVVLQDHLEEDRECDHRSAESDLLKQLAGDPEPEDGRAEQVGIEQRQLALTLAPDEPDSERSERRHPDQHEHRDGRSPSFPDEDAEHDAAHAQHRQHRADHVDTLRPVVGRVSHEPDPGKDDPDDDQLQEESHPPGQVRRDETAEERTDRRRDRGRCADQRIDPRPGRALEVAVDE